MGDVVPFTGEFYTRHRKAEDICDDVIQAIEEKLRTEYGFDTSNETFMVNTAYLLKFIEVMVHDELGLANKLSRDLKESDAKS